MSLYLKYRPKSLEEIRGNADVVSTLEGMLKDKATCPHTFLFHGQTGTGKTTMARIIATRLECSTEDFRELDTADFRGIDTVREVRRNSMFMPMNGAVRVWVLDECQKMTNDAQNALLKILEDTPPHVYFVLCTTEPHKLLPTIKGRCSQFQMNPLTERQMMGLLRHVVTEEKEILTREIYDQIIQDSLGLPRNALQILDQVLSVGEDQRMEVARQTAEQQSQSIELCRALIKQAPWKTVSEILRGLRDQEPEDIRRHVMGYCNSVLLSNENDQAAHVLEEFLEPTYSTGFSGIVYACYSIVKS